MSNLLSLDEWLGQLGPQYLDRFIASGGAAVKFAIGSDGTESDVVVARVATEAAHRHYVVVRLSSAVTRIHLIDRLFNAIAAEVPWSSLSTWVLADMARRNGLEVPKDLGDDGLASQIASCGGIDEGYVRMTLERAVANDVFVDRQLTRDFRIAMTWLCRARLNGGDEGTTITADITAWLTGEIGSVSVVRPYSLFTKVNRFNARHLLESLFTWVRRAGRPGTVVTLDLRALGRPRRVEGSQYYTKAALLDAYEVLRQFIDDTDDLAGALIVVIADAEFLDTLPGSRGIGAYLALMNRVYDEVRDRQRVNPMASLVRLGGGGDS
jgi:hypothetical protein